MASATGIFRQTGSFIIKLDKSLISAKAFSHRCPYAKICGASFPFCASVSRLRSHQNLSPCQVSNGQSGIPNAQPVQDSDERILPTPIVLIDQDSEPHATVVEISFGDRLGALLDTMKALMALGLDVSKASVIKDASLTRTKFFVKRLDNDRKVEDPELLEKIRLTIISGLLKYHPESSECLAMGEAFGTLPPRKKPNMDTATHIHIKDDGRRSILYLETADRPGLLLELMKIMMDSNVNVESAEIDTEGFVAKDKFYVSYRGSSLTKPVAEVLVNSLRYYLRRPETDIDSY